MSRIKRLAGQERLGEPYGLDVTLNIHHQRGDPAEIGQLVELDQQPGAVDAAPAHSARVAGIKVNGMEISL